MKRIIYLIALVFLIGHAQAQYSLPADPTGKKVTPPSPDVWQFAKYGEYPVSRETGVPNISIPLYTVQTGDLSVPISLSYHAGGIKVDDVASWVGLGWTLNAGGVVSRTVNVRPDESEHGLRNLKQANIPFVNPEGIIDMSQGDLSAEDDYMVFMNMKDGLIDTEPDVFNYSIGGHAGKFYLDPVPATFVSVRNGVTQPKDDVKIEVKVIDEPIKGYQIPEIIITTPDGTRYIFTETTIYVGGNFGCHSSWYLSRIESQNGKDAIHFFYRDIVQQFENVHRNETHSVLFQYPAYNSNPIVNPSRLATETGSYDNIKVLERIEFANGKVIFNSVDTREDSQKTRLTSIEIFDNLTPSAAKKTIVFDNDHYFVSTGSGLLSKRLKLKAIREKGRDGKFLPPHEFTYRETGTHQLPPRLSKAQDYWGYYNGKTSNPSLVPQVVYPYFHYTNSGSSNTLTIGNANREPDTTYMKAGIIQKIKYPTSGWTEFHFESNRISRTYWSTPPPQTQPSMSALMYNPGSTPTQVSNSYTPTVSGSGTAKLTIGSSAEYVHAHVYIKDNGVLVASYADVEVDTSFPITIIAGHTYQVFAEATAPATAFVTINWSVPSSPVLVTANQAVGGLRVKRIKSYDFNGILSFQKFFDYSVPGTSTSSGTYTAFEFPSPESFVTRTESFSGNNCNFGYDLDISVTSHPANQLGFPTGSVVAYEYVTERNEEGTNLQGKSIYQYDVTTKDKGIAFVNSLSTDQGYLRGQPISEAYYDKNNNLVKSVSYTYDTVAFPQYKIKGIRIASAVQAPGNYPCFCCHNCSETDGACDLRMKRVSNTLYITYNETPVWKRLRTKTEISDGITQVTAYDYDHQKRHTNVTGVLTRTSEGRITKTNLRYAHELNNATLISKNIIGVTLESDIRSDGSLVGGLRLSFGTVDGVFMPVNFEELLANETYRIRSQIVRVNAGGKVEEFVGSDGIVTAVKWDYNNQFLLAQVVNAKQNQIAFTSFEHGASEGGWTYAMSCTEPTACLAGCPNQNTDPYGYAQCSYACNNTYNQCLEANADANLDAKTGRRSFVGTTISKSGLPVANYLVSCWVKKSGATNGNLSISGAGTTTVSSDNWTHLQFTLTSVSSVTLSLSGVRIDDLRIHPVSSQMTSYTADPLVGVTTVTDPNNKISFYEYDGFDRLKLIRDQNKSILKKYSYNYKEQQ